MISSQVSQDLRLLERAAAEVKVAILIDTDIKSELAVEYVRKRPDHFPFLWLSDLLLYSQEEVCKEKLREIVDEDACINILRRILYSPAGNNYEPSLRRQLKRIEGVINSKKAENKKHQKPTGGEYIVFQIIAKICKMGIQKERLRSLDAWLQKNIKFAIMNVGYGLQVFLKTDLNGHHTISAAGDFADDLIINGEENDQAYIVICLNKIVNDFLEANGKERQPLQFHFYHTSQELIFEIFAAKELEKTNAKSGIDTP